MSTRTTASRLGGSNAFGASRCRGGTEGTGGGTQPSALSTAQQCAPSTTQPSALSKRVRIARGPSARVGGAQRGLDPAHRTYHALDDLFDAEIGAVEQLRVRRSLQRCNGTPRITQVALLHLAAHRTEARW